MGEATGIGSLDVAVLEAVASLTDAGAHVTTSTALDVVEAASGVMPDDAYRAVQRLVQPWHSWLSLLDGHGNFGSAHPDPAAGAQYTEVGLSEVGRAALAAERGEGGPFPIALCNGSLAHGGRRPPFAPGAVAACLRALIADPSMSDDALTRSLPEPASPNGCELEVDLAGLWAGEAVELVQRVRWQEEDGRVVVTAVPLGLGIDEVAHASMHAMHQDAGRRHADYLPGPVEHIDVEHEHGGGWFAYGGHRDGPRRGPDCHDESSERTGVRVVITPGGLRDLPWVRAELLTRWPLTVRQDVRLVAPLRDTLRTWAQRCSAGHQLEVLERA